MDQINDIAEAVQTIGVCGILAVALTYTVIYSKKNGKGGKCNFNNESHSLHFEKLEVILQSHNTTQNTTNTILQRLTDKVDRLDTRVKEIKNSERAA